MAKIALIGDIHANLPALERVLSHARRQDVDAVWNVGDCVGYGAFPVETVRRLQVERALSIAGNFDLQVLDFPRRQDLWREMLSPAKFRTFEWTYAQLGAEERRYLRSLPREVRQVVAGQRVLLVHGSPISIEEHLTPATPQARLRELARTASADLVICGHSHQPFVRRVDGVWFINTGSVGRPDDGDPRACYALVDMDTRSLDVQHYRLAYDLERAVAAVRTQGLPEALAQMFLQGRGLGAVS